MSMFRRAVEKFLSDTSEDFDYLKGTYKDLHAHPELSGAEKRTGGIVAAALTSLGYRVRSGVGGYGVAACLQNGEGPTVALRADMDALPVAEKTQVPYASQEVARDGDGKSVPVMHACGHDMHTTCLLGACRFLSQNAKLWGGNCIALFQPAEETISGAQAMVDDGVFAGLPKPDVILGQHVRPIAAGTVSMGPGPATSAGGSFVVKIHGRGAHGSMPHKAIDPVVAAAAIVLRLQAIVSREIEPGRHAVISVGMLQAGTKENVIPADALIKLTVRSRDNAVQQRLVASVKRVINAECEASGMETPPEVASLGAVAAVVNDAKSVAVVRRGFKAWFADECIRDAGPSLGAEDFGAFGASLRVPSVYWFLGCADPEVYAKSVLDGTTGGLPTIHNAAFLPVLEPTLRSGVAALLAGSFGWFGNAG